MLESNQMRIKRFTGDLLLFHALHGVGVNPFLAFLDIKNEQ